MKRFIALAFATAALGACSQQQPNTIRLPHRETLNALKACKVVSIDFDDHEITGRNCR